MRYFVSIVMSSEQVFTEWKSDSRCQPIEFWLA